MAGGTRERVARGKRNWIGPLALACLATPLLAEGAAPLGAAAPAAAPWWPPNQPDAAQAIAMGGWSMAPGGPMAMPTHVRDMVFGTSGTFHRQQALQGVLQRIWQHLAARVNDLEDMENRSKLLREETAQLRKRGIGGQNVLVRLEEKVRELWSHSRGRSEELRTKFQEVLLFKPRLKARFPQAGRDLDSYFLALKEGEDKVKKRYTSLGYELSATRQNLEAMAENRADKIRSMVGQVRSGTLPAMQLRGAPDKGALDDFLNVQEWEREYRKATPPTGLPPPPPPAPEGYYTPRSPVLPPPEPGWENLPPPNGWNGLPGTPVHPSTPKVPPPPPVISRPAIPPSGDAGADDLYSGSLLPRSQAGRTLSARELVRQRIERLRAMRAGGMTTQEMEREVRDRRDVPAPLLPPREGPPYAGPPMVMPPGMVPTPTGPAVDPRADELVDEFLEDEDVMDPYLSKADPAATGSGTATTDEALQRKLEQVFSTQGGGQPALRPPPEVGQLGTFAGSLQRDLEMASRTEGLDASRKFARSKGREKTVAEAAPQPQRSVQDILQELEALEE